GEDDDTSSLATMDPRAREWIVACARGEYNHIAKLLQEEPRLAKRRIDVIRFNLYYRIGGVKMGGSGILTSAPYYPKESKRRESQGAFTM
ncbi:hypothetical protein QYM36_004431, partial [Artemia franciscana]